MTTISRIWDSTTDVLSGRLGMIAPVALLTIFLPGVLSAANASYGTNGTLAFAAASFLLSMVTLFAAIWGQLAIIAIATDPATTLGSAQEQATARLLPTIGVTLALVAALVVLTAPIFVALAMSGVAVTALSSTSSLAMPNLPASTSLFLLAYIFVLGIVMLIVSARLVLTNAVVLNERRGIGAIRRSIALTQGLTLKLIGVAILFGIVLMIATLAAQSVSGVIFRLILGAENKATAAFLAAIVGALVSTGFTALAYVFTARLYVATRQDRDGLAAKYEATTTG